MMFMINYKEKCKQIVHDIFEEVNNNDIASVIETRLDCYTLDKYSRELPDITNNKQYHGVIIFLMKKIYCDACSDEAALLARGIFFIDNFCPGYNKDGYENIYYHILSRQISIFDLITLFIEAVKYYEQYNMIENICKKYIDPFDYELKKAVVKQIVAEYSMYLRYEIVQSPVNYSSRIPRVVKEAIDGYNNFWSRISQSLAEKGDTFISLLL